MEYRSLGKSGLKVSALSLGTMTFGGGGKFAFVGDTDAKEAKKQLDMAIAAGVNLVDTANVYSDGESERIVGEIVKGRRDDLLLATKARFGMGSGPNDEGLSRHHLLREAEASLKRLGTDYIDLYQVHQWDGQTPLEETLSALTHLVDSGKVRYVGVSNFSAWHLMKAVGIADHRGFAPLVSQQIHYSLNAREAEYELVPLAVDQGVGILVWSPLAGGLLSGKYRRNEGGLAGSRVLTEWNEPPIPDIEKLYDIVEVLVEVGAAHGVSAAQVALAWTLGRPAISTVIIGARTSEQLADNLAAADLVLTDEETTRLEEVSRPTLLYPYWHQVASAGKRLAPADLTLLERHRQG
jgi:aryl-alcohol dehydrogenase-like predicted oxidoreductase